MLNHLKAMSGQEFRDFLSFFDKILLTVLPLFEVMRKCTGVDDFPVAVTVKGLPEQNVGTNRAGEKPSLTRGKLGCCFDSKPLEENKKWSREVGDHPRMVAALPESPG